MKLGTIINALPSIDELVKLKMDAQKAFDIIRFIKSLDPEIKSFNELKDAKIRELGEEKDGNITVKEENKQEYFKYLNELADKDIDIEAPKLKKEDINGDIAISHLIALDFLFE